MAALLVASLAACGSNTQAETTGAQTEAEGQKEAAENTSAETEAKQEEAVSAVAAPTWRPLPEAGPGWKGSASAEVFRKRICSPGSTD